MALNGWHSGEREVHTKLGHDDDYRTMNLFREVEGDLSEEIGYVFTHIAPLIPVVTLDAEGRPWSSILTGEQGQVGFSRRPKYSTLRFKAKFSPGDPILGQGFKSAGEKALIAGVGIDFIQTRTRMKFAGNVQTYEVGGGTLEMEVFVNQAAANCPKYIVTRDLQSHPEVNPTILYSKPHLSPEERLPDDLVSFILNSDTAFLGTSYQAPAHEADRFPSHLGINERSGYTGFIRVLPSDGRTIVLPDYSGNRYMTSLGNIQITPVASLTFISWTTGAILYITGDAQNHFPPSSYAIMPFQHTLTTIRATGYIFVADALPIRQRAGTEESYSRYSPPIRYLAEEAVEKGLVLFQESGTSGAPKIEATLAKIVTHSQDIATFTWEVDVGASGEGRKMEVEPGQAVIMDFTPLIGPQQYVHMAPYKPSSVNDDRMRTWTVSSSASLLSANQGGGKGTFEITVKEKPGGAVTGALFAITRKLQQIRPELLKDARGMGLKIGIVGVVGDFVLPDGSGAKKMLWIAGGIGVTPFLAMLNGLGTKASDDADDGGYDIHLILSTREPAVVLHLLSTAMSSLCAGAGSSRHQFTLDVFSHKSIPAVDGPESIILRRHEGRPDQDILQHIVIEGNAKDRKVYVCGPPAFEKIVFRALRRVDGAGRVKREGFGY